MIENTDEDSRVRGNTYLYETQEIPSLRIVITDIAGVTELESRDYHFVNVVNGMNFLIKKHQEILKSKQAEPKKDNSIG